MKTFWIVVVIVVALGAVWWFNSSKSTNMYGSPQTSSSPTPTTSGTSSGYKKSTATPVPVISGKTYTQLVAEFGNNRIQFGQNCQAQPASLALKNGTTIMLDNRSNQTHTITVNGTKYTIMGYGYQIVTVSSPTLPKAIGLGCDSSVNVGTIQLQANISGE